MKKFLNAKDFKGFNICLVLLYQSSTAYKRERHQSSFSNTVAQLAFQSKPAKLTIKILNVFG